MRQIVTITAVKPDPEAWQDMHVYTLTVKSEASGNTRDVLWYRKHTSQAPVTGERIEAEFKQTKKPPGWQLKDVRPVNADGSVPSYGRAAGLGSHQPDDRTADIHRQVALKAASSLFGPMLAQCNPMTSTTEWWTRFWVLYEHATDRIERLITQREQQQELPVARTDVERTGESDIPAPAAGEFEHKQVTDTEGIPF